MSENKPDKTEEVKDQDSTVKEVQKQKGELAEEQLEKVSGGAFPTSVNSQITDSVT